MSLRLNHFISIDSGKISIRFAGDPEDAAPHLFDTEKDAIAALAPKMVEIPQARLMTSSSINWPEEDGRPDFDGDRFMKDLHGVARALTTVRDTVAALEPPRGTWEILGRFEASHQRTTLWKLPDGLYRRQDVDLRTGKTTTVETTDDFEARVEFQDTVNAIFLLRDPEPMYDLPPARRPRDITQPRFLRDD